MPLQPTPLPPTTAVVERLRARRKRRILVAHFVPPGRAGGMGRLMGFMHDELVATGEWEVDYFCADRLPANTRPPIERILFPAAVLKHVRQALRQGQPYDVINIHEPIAAPVILCKRLIGHPHVVVTSHGLEQRVWELDQEEARLGRKALVWRNYLARPLTILWPSRYALKKADHVFCLNEEDKNCLRRWLMLPAKKITRLCPGVSPIFAQAAEERSYQLAERLLFAGTWRHNKGINDLVPAFEVLARQFSNLNLTVLGAGVPADAVLSAFPEALRARVEVVSSATEAESANIFARSDMFVLPSLLEGTPLTLIEAMASGLPIVTTETCGMRDVIRDGQNGCLVPIRSPQALAATTTKLIENPDLRKTLGRQARENAMTSHTWSEAAKPVATAYNLLLESTI